MTTLLRNVRPWGSASTDLAIDDAGCFTRLDGGAGREIDGRGYVALPGLVNAHAHVDKSWVGLPWESFGGERSTAGRIAHERERRDALGIPSVATAAATLEELLRYGTTALRTHVDVDLGIGLRGIEAVREAVGARVPRLRYAVVAFPQDGVIRRPGVATLLRRAAEEGAEFVGGLDPAGIDRDPAGQLDALFAIAGDTGCGVDIHLHDPGELGAFQIELIADRTRRIGLQGKVNLAHGLALGELAADRRERLIAAMAELDISVSTVAPLAARPLPAAELRAAGVRVGLGTDGFRDLWSPFGTGDLLTKAAMHARMTGARTDAELAFVLRQATSAGLTFVGEEDPVADDPEAGVAELLRRYAAADFAPGRQADLVLVDAENAMDALVRYPKRELVMIAGEVVVPRRRDPRPGDA